MRFDLVDLRLFLNVVECGSITGGAERSNLALASASARIGGMEQTLGAPLLGRMPRGVTPTAAGQVLADHARVVLAQVERMRGDLAGYAAGLRVGLKLLANTVAASEFLPDPLADFLAGNPPVDVELQVLPSRRIVELVAAGAADLGVLAAHAGTEGLETVPFRLDRLVVAAPPAHPAAGRDSIRFRDLLEERLVGLPAQSALNLHLEDHAAKLGRRMDVRVRLGDFGGICRLVSRGVGLAVVPEAAALRHDPGRLRIIPLAEPWAVRQLVICMRSRAHLSPPATRLLACLTAAGEGGG